MNRRTFCGAAIASGAALGAAAIGCGGNDNTQRQKDAGKDGGKDGGKEALAKTQQIQFNFTGLLAAEIWEKTRKQMRVSLVDAAAAGVVDPHATVLMVRLADYVWARQCEKEGGAPRQGQEIHKPPQILRLGDEIYGLWTLTSTRVWMADSGITQYQKDASFTADTDTHEMSFAFAKGTSDVMKKPANEADWAGRERFVTKRDLTGFISERNPDFDPARRDTSIDPDLVTSRILLTRGTATGLEPKGDCELSRMYALGNAKVSRPARPYAGEFKVLYDVGNDTTDILITALRPDGSPFRVNGDIIRLRTPPGKVVPVSIANSPLSHQSHDHFVAYSKLFRLPETVCLFNIEGDCQSKDNPHQDVIPNRDKIFASPRLKKLQEDQKTAECEQTSSHAALNPPDPGCVPIFEEIDGEIDK